MLLANENGSGGLVWGSDIGVEEETEPVADINRTSFFPWWTHAILEKKSKAAQKRFFTQSHNEKDTSLKQGQLSRTEY